MHLALSAFIVLASLFPKIPLRFVEYTYIRIRYDDILPVALVGIFIIQLLRKKVKFNTKFLLHVLIFWTAVFISFFAGYHFFKTIPVFNIGLLHSLRRVQYIIVFFVAASAISSKRQFERYMKIYFLTLLLVTLYGIGQKFLQFPSIQSMNPAYVDGRLLVLTEFDRINSTFGGHFDLAAYLTFSIPILFGFYFNQSKKLLFGTFIMSLVTLLYTAARSSYISYIVSITSFLLLHARKFKLYFIVLLLTAGLTVTTGEMAKRFSQTFQVKTIYIDELTGDVKIDQRYDKTSELPAGGFKLPLAKQKTVRVDEAQLRRIALEKALKEAERQGRQLNTKEIEKRANEISKIIKPKEVWLCDIACSTRLQIEWPRAIGAFLYSPVLGTGPSSITEATDNNILRWLGEFGLLGTSAFIFLLGSIVKRIWNYSKKFKNEARYKYTGFVFGLFALLINALYVDVFEASKVAYNFWTVAGLYIGLITLNEKGSSK